jgi:phosphopantetheine--protein transferase-like protein
MVGNDVVDLADVDADASTYSTRFDERAFSVGERAWLDATGDAERARWELWAAKEAAFKAVKRGHRAAVFSPSALEVQITTRRADGEAVRSTGHVTLGEAVATRLAGERLRFEIDADRERVHAVAWGAGDLAPLSEVAALPHAVPASDIDPSAFVRRRLVRRLAAALGVPRARLSLGRRARVPVVMVDGRDASIDVSLSHHGRFVACAWSPRGVRRARALMRPVARRVREVCA